MDLQMINRLFFLQILANLCRSIEDLQIENADPTCGDTYCICKFENADPSVPTSWIAIFKFADPISITTKQYLNIYVSFTYKHHFVGTLIGSAHSKMQIQ